MKTVLEQLGEKILLLQVKRRALLKSSVLMVKLRCCCESNPCLCLEEVGMQSWFILHAFESQFFAAILCSSVAFLKHTQNPVSVTTEDTVLMQVRCLTFFLPFQRSVIAYSFLPGGLLYFQVCCVYSFREDVQV